MLLFTSSRSGRAGRVPTIPTPITVKASYELALTLVTELKKGVSFVVEGQLAYYKSPETNQESYSIWADSFSEMSLPKTISAKAT